MLAVMLVYNPKDIDSGFPLTVKSISINEVEKKICL